MAVERLQVRLAILETCHMQKRDHRTPFAERRLDEIQANKSGEQKEIWAYVVTQDHAYKNETPGYEMEHIVCFHIRSFLLEYNYITISAYSKVLK